MSVTLLPEWKQLLLERKRREEEERGRREKEEEEKFANMPAWKRGIIQRRKAKQDVFGDREKEREVSNQVSLETIVPVHENPFIRTQCVWRKGRDGEGGNELEVKERENFSDRVISAKENGLCGEKYYDRKTRERIHSDRSGTPWVDVASLRRETTAKIKLGCARLLDKERFAKYRDGLLKIEHRSEVKKVDLLDKRAAENVYDVDGDEGFTVATVKNTEGISFQTFSVTPSFVRSRSPDNFLRATDCAPTPASSPCSPSPSQSPNISPSPSPSPTLFSIRSASGGPVKRGATITITPKKTVLGAAMGHTVRPMAAELTSTNTKSLQNHISTTAAEESKKKYPTVEEIEVIGGYENLERSCLIKKGGTPKRVSKDNKPEKTFFIQCYSLGTKNTQK
uniref:Uncharacterized protein n=1 Tax=Gouania willdenowi TaxID=441366 RepID=A0A8C5GD90_GOUWI